ncbi:MAG: hypothetical protein IT317_21320 [Anaerolineales bacterium]|nr:hypothetical protein [Anaerolineales bacterium]
MRATVRGLVLGVLLMVPMACGRATETPVLSPTEAATQPEPRPTVGATPTKATATTLATATHTATPVPSPTPTLDPTRIAAMTLEAIRVAVTASGVPEGSTEFEAQVAATRCALIPPPTATPMPWRLAPEEPYVVSTNCLGSDLPGQGVRLWQDDVWIEAQGYQFAASGDLETARQAYVAFLDVISLQAGPPTDDFAATLSDHMVSTDVLPSPQSCLADEITGHVAALRRQGLYVRLTFTEPLEWDGDYFLFVSPVETTLALPWSASSVRQELVSIENNSVARAEQLAGLAGTARLRYDAEKGRWLVTDDARGYYCHALPAFIR